MEPVAGTLPERGAGPFGSARGNASREHAGAAGMDLSQFLGSLVSCFGQPCSEGAAELIKNNLPSWPSAKDHVQRSAHTFSAAHTRLAQRTHV